MRLAYLLAVWDDSNRSYIVNIFISDKDIRLLYSIKINAQPILM